MQPALTLSASERRISYHGHCECKAGVSSLQVRVISDEGLQGWSSDLASCADWPEGACPPHCQRHCHLLRPYHAESPRCCIHNPRRKPAPEFVYDLVADEEIRSAYKSK